MKNLKVLFVAAAVAAAVLPAACDTAAWQPDADNPGTAFTGAGPAGSLTQAGWKVVTVKFTVLNGGRFGLKKSQGIVSSQDNSILVWNGNICANDFTITITVPRSDEYLNIYWWGVPIWPTERDRYLKAKLEVSEYGKYYTIVIDYNGNDVVTTENLFDIRQGDLYGFDYSDAFWRAEKD